MKERKLEEREKNKKMLAEDLTMKYIGHTIRFPVISNHGIRPHDAFLKSLHEGILLGIEYGQGSSANRAEPVVNLTVGHGLQSREDWRSTFPVPIDCEVLVAFPPYQHLLSGDADTKLDPGGKQKTWLD